MISNGARGDKHELADLLKRRHSHSVIAGLDPATHPFREDDGCPGQARARRRVWCFRMQKQNGPPKWAR
jgi:hypothetical protein